MNNEMRERLIDLLIENRIEIERDKAFIFADKLIKAGVIFNPETDIRPKFKVGQEVWRIYNTRGCGNCTKKNIECDGIECPESTIRTEKYQYKDVNKEWEQDLYATEQEARAALKEGV